MDIILALDGINDDWILDAKKPIKTVPRWLRWSAAAACFFCALMLLGMIALRWFGGKQEPEAFSQGGDEVSSAEPEVQAREACVILEDSELGLKLEVLEDVAEAVECNPSEGVPFALYEPLNRAEINADGGGLIWEIHVYTAEEAKARQLWDGANWSRGAADAGEHLLGTKDGFVYVLLLPTDVRYVSEAQASYSVRQELGRKMLIRFIEINGIDESGDWAEAYPEYEGFFEPMYPDERELSAQNIIWELDTENCKILLTKENGETVDISLPESYKDLSEKEYSIISGSISCAAYNTDYQELIAAFVPELGEQSWVFVSRDGGESFISGRSVRIISDEVTGSSIGFTSVSEGWLLIQGPLGTGMTENRLFTTVNGGESWGEVYLQEETVRIRPIGYITFLTAQEGYVSAGAGTGDALVLPSVYQTLDGGSTWSRCTLDTTMTEGVLGVSQITMTENGREMTGYTGTGNGVVKLVSADGLLWTETERYEEPSAEELGLNFSQEEIDAAMAAARQYYADLAATEPDADILADFEIEELKQRNEELKQGVVLQYDVDRARAEIIGSSIKEDIAEKGPGSVIILQVTIPAAPQIEGRHIILVRDGAQSEWHVQGEGY